VDVVLGSPSTSVVGGPTTVKPLVVTPMFGGIGLGASSRRDAPVKPGLPTIKDSVLGHPDSVLGRPRLTPDPPTSLTALGRPPRLTPGEVPELPTVDIATTVGGAPVRVPAPVIGSTSLTGSASSRGRADQPEGEDTLTVRQAMPMPAMPGMALAGAAGPGRQRDTERTTWLTGDEDWDPKKGADGAIGRPATLASREEG
jgi:hypothetical protein